VPWAGSALSIFNGGDPNGTWRLYVVDDASGDTGNIASWGILFSFDNNDHLNIPAGAPDVTAGSAMPYPSMVTVEGRSGTVQTLRVKIHGFAHTFPDDVDVLLVGPQGQNIVLMSDDGGSTDVTGIDLTFDDLAPGNVPDAGPLTSGTYLPTNVIAGDTLPAPAPVPSAATALNATFAGTDPNGIWRLFVADDSSGDFGSWEGWSLDITTAQTASGGAITVPPSGTAVPYPSTLTFSGVLGSVASAVLHHAPCDVLVVDTA
jgi:subtilisin-like proprotein convertase family protein